MTRKPTPKKLGSKELRRLDAILAAAREAAKADRYNQSKIAVLVDAIVHHPNPKPPCATS